MKILFLHGKGLRAKHITLYVPPYPAKQGREAHSYPCLASSSVDIYPPKEDTLYPPKEVPISVPPKEDKGGHGKRRIRIRSILLSVFL